MQLEGLFDVAPRPRSELVWTVDLPIDDSPWHLGLILGPSGCGKTTLLRELFAKQLVAGFSWPAGKSILDAFPASMPIKEITGLLSSVGFSSPPSWLRPYRVLSAGEQFRATIARALAEHPALAAVDEFTSVVDRQVARIASAAIARSVRARGNRLILASCHYDVVDWLQPDWIYEPASNTFTRRELQRRPPIELELVACGRATWQLFAPHHYLSADLNRVGTRSYCGLVDGTPATFAAVCHFPHAIRPGWREHRIVCLPDFQGVGLGHATSAAIAAIFRATGRPYRSTTSHPGMIAHRCRSPLWRMVRAPSLGKPQRGRLARGRGFATAGLQSGKAVWNKHAAVDRLTASFEYVGPADPAAARGFGLI